MISRTPHWYDRGFSHSYLAISVLHTLEQNDTNRLLSRSDATPERNLRDWKTPVRTTPTTLVSPPTFAAVSCAPWLALARENQAVSILANATHASFWVAFVVHLSLFASLVTAMRLWHARILVSDWQAHRIPTATEVWRNWHATTSFGPAENTFCIAAVGAIAVNAVFAWLFLPQLHLSGPLARTFWQSYRIVFAIAGYALVLLATSSVSVMGMIEYTIVTGSSMAWANNVAVVLCAVAACLVVGIIHLTHMVHAVRDVVPPHENPRRCESCGYDLTHIPANDSCTECGASLRMSLDASAKRYGSAWENTPSMRTWFTTSFRVLFHTREFYGRLHARTDDRSAMVFAWRHLALIGFASALVMFLPLWLSQYLTIQQCVFDAVTFGLLSLMLAWFALHGACTLVLFWWVARGSTLRLYLTRKIYAYETAYLAQVSLFFVVLLVSLQISPRWITNALGRDFFAKAFSMSAESVVTISAIAVFTGIWQWRITVAIRNLRWANH